MRDLLLVGIGGFAGAILRYRLGGWVLHHTMHWTFPAGTFCVNVLGCLVAGLLMALVVKHDVFSPGTRLLLFTGIMGGFTTFSAFGLEFLYLVQRHEPGWAAVYVLATVTMGLAALWVGTCLVRG